MISNHNMDAQRIKQKLWRVKWSTRKKRKTFIGSTTELYSKVIVRTGVLWMSYQLSPKTWWLLCQKLLIGRVSLSRKKLMWLKLDRTNIKKRFDLLAMRRLNTKSGAKRMYRFNSTILTSCAYPKPLSTVIIIIVPSNQILLSNELIRKLRHMKSGLNSTKKTHCHLVWYYIGE